MSKIAIITDSTASMPPNLLEKYSVTCLPQVLIWDHTTYRDLVDIQPDAFYQRLSTSKTMPTTSQVSMQDFNTAYKRLLDQGSEILCILISSKLSGTIASAQQAKENFPGAPIEIIDSLSTSLAMSFQILSAAQAAGRGASLKECAQSAKKVLDKSGVLFAVDTLEFLHRGGRIGGAARFLGTALGLKPILEVRSGKIEPVERVRTQRKSFERLLDLVGERVAGSPAPAFGVLDANAPDSSKFLCDQIMERFKVTEVIASPISPVLGTHTGPGTVGVAYYTGE